FELVRRGAERRVRLPPVDPHLLGAVDGGDEQTQLDRQQLDVEQVDLDVARDDDALVEHTLEDVREAAGSGRGGRWGAQLEIARTPTTRASEIATTHPSSPPACARM